MSSKVRINKEKRESRRRKGWKERVKGKVSKEIQRGCENERKKGKCAWLDDAVKKESITVEKMRKIRKGNSAVWRLKEKEIG